jgi:hypothetical protein
MLYLSVPLPQSLVFYVMFSGPLSYCPFSLLMLYLSVPLPQSLVFCVMFSGPLSYCPFSLLMLQRESTIRQWSTKHSIEN